jgi:response regulator RpfG family c-di-GMP phosphodiesterase
MDGLQATKLIRQGEAGAKHVPIIAMTANAMESDRERCIEAGMDDYLSKPIKALELQQMLERFAKGVPVPAELSDPVAESAVETAAPAVFDYAKALAAQDQEMVEIVAEAFVAQWPADKLKLREALGKSELNVVLYTAHALKGTLSMFGAAPAAHLAAQIETMASESDAAGIGRILDFFVLEVERLLAEMSDFTAQ